MTNHLPLDARTHRDLRIRPSGPSDEVMACITVPSEFRRLQNEFPILFRRDVDGGAFSALALLGFENGENLYVEGGRWTARYRPQALAIQPFLVGRGDDGGPASVHLDLDHPRVAGPGEEGIRIFAENGQPTPYLEAVMAGLDELDQGYRASGAFFEALERYELLEPFSLDVELNDGSNHRMVGYHLIDEAKLQSLEAGALAELHNAGHLMPIFMAIASLSNLAALVDRKNARRDHG